MILILLLLFICNSKTTFSVINDSKYLFTPEKPKNVIAYSVGTNVTIKWDYEGAPSIGTLSFEIEEFGILIANIVYPNKQYTSATTYGPHTYRIRAKWTYTIMGLTIKDYSDWVYVVSYVLNKPTGLKVSYDQTLLLFDPASLNLIVNGILLIHSHLILKFGGHQTLLQFGKRLQHFRKLKQNGLIQELNQTKNINIT